MAERLTGMSIKSLTLLTGNITPEDPSSKFKSFVGGMGFASKIMATKYRRALKPSMKNKLVSCHAHIELIRCPQFLPRATSFPHFYSSFYQSKFE